MGIDDEGNGDVGRPAIASPRRSSSSAVLPPPKVLLALTPQAPATGRRGPVLSIDTNLAAQEVYSAMVSRRKSPHVYSVNLEVEEEGAANNSNNKGSGAQVEVVVVGGEGIQRQEGEPSLQRLAVVATAAVEQQAAGQREEEGELAPAVVAEVKEKEQEELSAIAGAVALAGRSRGSDSVLSTSESGPLLPAAVSDTIFVPTSPCTPESILRRSSSYLDGRSGKPASPLPSRCVPRVRRLLHAPKWIHV